jgi:hypothetical protein
VVGINDGGVLGMDVGTLVDGWEVGCDEGQHGVEIVGSTRSLRQVLVCETYVCSRFGCRGLHAWCRCRESCNWSGGRL